MAKTQTVEAPQAQPSAQDKLTYGDACKLISRILVGNPAVASNAAQTVEAIREVIDGTGLPSNVVAPESV